MAAAAVFNRHGSQQSLSSAAAAAALRARPTTPTNVSEVQTKRTMRRSASMSSSGTAPDARRNPSLHRSGSSASLSEKTFRTPSPHRPAAKTTSPAGQDAPPVPALPENFETRSNGTGGPARQQHRKANSLGLASTPVRLASQKLGREGSPSWFGGALVGDMNNIRTSDAAIASPSKLDLDENRPSSRASSINFSYPARVRVASPPPSSPIERRVLELPPQPKRASSMSSSTRSRPVSTDAAQSLVYDPNSRRMVPRYDGAPEDLGGRTTSEKANKKHKAPPAKGGTRLAQGTVGRAAQVASARSGSNINTSEAEATREPDYEHEEPAVKAIIKSPRLAAKKLEHQRAQAVPVVSSLSEADGNAISLPSDTGRVGPSIRRQPSIVREQPELEDDEAELGSQQSVTDALDSVRTKQDMRATAEEPTQPDPTGLRQSNVRSPPPRQFAELPGEAVTSRDVATADHDKPVLYEPQATSRITRDRTHSNSPARTAHFGTVQEGPSIKHSPPPRSISPRKPALKQRGPSSRELSPDGGASETSSNVYLGDELSVPRRRSVRVSFDDSNNVVVGQSASPDQVESTGTPISQNDEARRPWYASIARTKKKDIVPLDDDELMKPRPALPSFGSVRGKKPRESSPGEEGRPLVRPYEPKPETAPNAPIEASTDSAIGGLLYQEADQVSRNAANISRFREPLPPIVTSVEGGGYMSDSSTESEKEMEKDSAQAVESSAVIHEGPVADASTLDDKPLNGFTLGPESDHYWTPVPTAAKTESKDAEDGLPVITLSRPTPPTVKTTREASFFDIPGGFPEDESSEASTRGADQRHSSSIPVEPAREEVLEPVAQREAARQPSHTLATIASTNDEDTDDTGSSIYSDANEDFLDTDIEGDGFLSLDAVVESPIGRPRQPSYPAPEQAQRVANPEADPSRSSPLQPVPHLSSEATANRRRSSPPELAPQLSSETTVVDFQPQGAPEDDWEKAKTFWRSLTAEKRAQLEMEAKEDAGAEGDLEGTHIAPHKPKKKKSLDRRNSERKALAVHMAQQMMAKQQDQDQRTDYTDRAERTYMIKPGTKVNDDGSTPRTHDSSALRKSMRKEGSILKPSGTDRYGHATAEGKTTGITFSGPGPRATKGHARQTSELSSSTASIGGARSAILPTSLRRRGSSSSESSFRRSQPRQTEGFGFRKTMRPSSPPGSEAAGRRFSLRSLSPTGTAFSRSSMPASNTGLRQTLRQTAPQEARTGTGLFGRKNKKQQHARSKFGGSKSSSRFGDSTDEDEGGASALGSRFRSRFDGSSSDDDGGGGGSIKPRDPRPLSMAKSMRPGSRGKAWPATAVGADSKASPPLPEEEEEEDEEKRMVLLGNAPQSRPAAARAQPSADSGLRRSRSGRGELMGSPTTPTAAATTTTTITGGGGSTRKKRSSLMDVLRRRRHNTGGGIQRRAEGEDAAARRDTPLERGADELRGIRAAGTGDDDEGEGEGEFQGEERPRSPRLQKRTAASLNTTLSARRGSGATWPLPMGAEGDREEEFAGAGSGNLGTRTLSGSTVLPRRTASSGLFEMDGAGAAGTGGEVKKKKFGVLRRMFGLPE
ncbi:hypothetical protein QBC33DRAFT_356251 [Phialemonium atrogriseum]|uniref:Uncharacterized protein n=1 Tax=Phialemonium atrogriseum TaxID=1093897 RepID=A0AAJ0C412_9PEZI|nr:uncharacterized protein QBC33DRAFT_356251 [Phialemonium atrogriseum]KAK1768708.1 hypothetical protein QBC33DRAFT_356251 [Phialemonium atrogriseum]